MYHFLTQLQFPSHVQNIWATKCTHLSVVAQTWSSSDHLINAALHNPSNIGTLCTILCWCARQHRICKFYQQGNWDFWSCTASFTNHKQTAKGTSVFSVPCSSILSLLPMLAYRYGFDKQCYLEYIFQSMLCFQPPILKFGASLPNLWCMMICNVWMDLGAGRGLILSYGRIFA